MLLGFNEKIISILFILVFLILIILFILKKNLILILAIIEIILFLISVNFLILSIFIEDIIGTIISLSILIVSGCETALGLSLVVSLWRITENFNTINLIYLKFFVNNKLLNDNFRIF